MSAGKKRERSEAESADRRQAKKLKKEKRKEVEAAAQGSAADTPSKEVGETDLEAQEIEKEEKRKRKEEKRARKEAKRQRKAEKQATGETSNDTSSNAAPAPVVPPTDSDVNEESKPSKKKSKKLAVAVAEKEGGGYVYNQTTALLDVADSTIKAYLKDQFISIANTGADAGSGDALRPVLEFSHLPVSEVTSKGAFATYKAPTPIQAASWPYSLSRRDVVGIAETGSGKTMAFALPCVELLNSTKPQQPARASSAAARPRAVIVSPTRELAMQTHASVSALAALVGLSAVCVYGGASKDEQRALLRKKRGGADIIVATPGRLKDFLSEGCIDLSDAGFAVLDEADRMLDKGFEEDIKLILGQCPPREKRQTLMFTATWPTSVRSLAESFMVNPVRITIGANRAAATDGTEGEDGSGGNGTIELQANSRITQLVEVVDPRGKEQRLAELLKEAQRGSGRTDRILVFCLYKKEAVRVEQFLERRGIRVASIHGDLKQEHRTQSLEAFKAGTTSVLVATDVAARGLDIPEVKLVINVTFPLTIEDYVHRIGRTGRAGKTGKAITLFTEHDKAHSGSLINVLRAANQDVPESLLKFGTTVKKKAHDTYGAFYKDVDMTKKSTKITFD